MSDEKRQLLREALRDILDQCLNDPSVEYSEFPEKLVGMVVAAGWQWHPPKTPEIVEEWRDIPGYANWEMSNTYRVRNKFIKDHWVDYGVEVENLKDRQDLIERTWPKTQTEILFENGNLAIIPDEVYTGKITPVEIIAEEWKDLTGLPTQAFEISKDGRIRNKKTHRELEPQHDINYNVDVVHLMINGKEYNIIGAELAKLMWDQ